MSKRELVVLRKLHLRISFVRPGEQVSFNVSRESGDGTLETLSSTFAVQFRLLTNEQHVDISETGVLTVNSVASPFSTFSETDIVLVDVFADGQFGVGQVMIIDVDTDGDILLDYYEESVGLDPFVATYVFEDNNGAAIRDTAVSYFQRPILTAASFSTSLPIQNDPVQNESLPNDVETTTDAEPQSDVSGGGVVSFWLFVLLLANWTRRIVSSRRKPW